VCLPPEQSEIDRPEVNSLSTRDIYYRNENHYHTALRKRQRLNSSSDSSLLVAGVMMMADSLARDKIPDKYGEREKAQLHLQMRNRAEIPHTEASNHVYNSQETFTKRPRRKTRQDLYDSKDRKRNSELHRQEKRPRTKEEKKTDRKRVTRKLGEDLMHNFSSESIAGDRLTVSMWFVRMVQSDSG
jgi:hypothetical protein